MQPADTVPIGALPNVHHLTPGNALMIMTLTRLSDNTNGIVEGGRAAARDPWCNFGHRRQNASPSLGIDQPFPPYTSTRQQVLETFGDEHTTALGIYSFRCVLQL